MPTYLMLSNLTDEGAATIKKNPIRGPCYRTGRTNRPTPSPLKSWAIARR